MNAYLGDKLAEFAYFLAKYYYIVTLGCYLVSGIILGIMTDNLYEGILSFFILGVLLVMDLTCYARGLIVGAEIGGKND